MPSLFEDETILLQRLEGLAALVAGTMIYSALGQSWLMFALLFLVPDIAMVGYLKSPRLGARLYNLVHTYCAPAMLALVGTATSPILYAIAAVWFAHIGFDRMIGAGLKFPSGFGDTHLGRMGRGVGA